MIRMLGVIVHVENCKAVAFRRKNETGMLLEETYIRIHPTVWMVRGGYCNEDEAKELEKMYQRAISITGCR